LQFGCTGPAGTFEYSNRRKACLSRWCDKASRLLVSVGLLGKGKGASVHMLLNKLLGIRVEMQGQLFSYFSAIMDKVRRSTQIAVCIDYGQIGCLILGSHSNSSSSSSFECQNIRAQLKEDLHSISSASFIC
jgi:hypothetical protein